MKTERSLPFSKKESKMDPYLLTVWFQQIIIFILKRQNAMYVSFVV